MSGLFAVRRSHPNIVPNIAASILSDEQRFEFAIRSQGLAGIVIGQNIFANIPIRVHIPAIHAECSMPAPVNQFATVLLGAQTIGSVENGTEPPAELQDEDTLFNLTLQSNDAGVALRDVVKDFFKGLRGLTLEAHGTLDYARQISTVFFKSSTQSLPLLFLT